MKKIFFALTMLLVLGSTLWIENVSAAKVVFVPIRNTADWDTFKAEVNKAKGQYWVDARLEADITVTQPVGWDNDAPFRGTFDGNGHTLNMSISGANNRAVALFRNVGDVTISDLHVTGKVSGGLHTGGLIGECQDGNPNVTLNRVWVSTEVTTTDRLAGGIIGHAKKAIVNLNDCLFDGKITTNNSSSSYAGCIIGWCDGGGWTFHRVYNHPAETPKARIIWFCVDYNVTAWGSNGKSSLTVTSTSWGDWKVNYYNKTDQNEVIRLMNAEQAGSWHIVSGKAVPVLNQAASNGGWAKLGGSNDGYILQSGSYYITENVTFKNVAKENGLTIADGATVRIYIPKGVTLTAQGGDASGQSGAGAGIYLPKGSTLILEGGGTVKATGGNAASGGNGGNGSSAHGNYSYAEVYPGKGGDGGDGGGGAGAGIGTRGGNGGKGGAGGDTGTRKYKTDCGGAAGGKGSVGQTAGDMGMLFVNNGITVDATGGSKGASNGSGGKSGSHYLLDDKANQTAAGGGGGGGGGFGGAASKIGTGGPGGGGGGGGSGGSCRYKWDPGYYRVGNAGGGTGMDADGSWHSSDFGKSSEMTGTQYFNSDDFSDKGYQNGSGAPSYADGAACGNASRSKPIVHTYSAKFNAVSAFGDKVNVEKSGTIGYKSNVSDGRVSINVPPYNVLGITDRDKYVTQWNTSVKGDGKNLHVNDEYQIGSGTNNFYGVWKPYEGIFPEGYGTKSKPFIIKEENLLDFADYVNIGGNTRDLYFKQEGDFVIQDITKGKSWTPIGHTNIFEGDYDGGGNRFRSGTIANTGNYIGIFGKVSGSIHHLGVENIKIENDKAEARCGAIVGQLLGSSAAKQGQYALPTAGDMNNCYAANNEVKAVYAGGLAGELINSSTMRNCHGSNNTLTGTHSAGIASQILDQAKVDNCFTTAGNIASNGSSTRSEANASDKLASGEVTWNFNDKTAFGVAWFQNLDKEGVQKNAYPVLDSTSNRVYEKNKSYTNEPSGTLFALSGKGLPNDPFLVTSIEEWNFVADFCNGDNNKITAVHFLQTADFDLKGGTLKRIGNSEGHTFDGYYDGGGHTIRNGVIDGNAFVGVFGHVTGTVTRLGVEGMTIKSSTDATARVGGIAGRLRKNGEISNCYVKNSNVASNKNRGVAGGIVADMYDNALVRNCFTYENTLTAVSAGFICGEMVHNGTRLLRCFTNEKSMVSSVSHGTTSDCGPNTSASEFANGSITYILNDRNNSNPDPVWYQNITGDTNLDYTPVLSSNRGMVFYRNGVYTNDAVNLSRLGKGTEAEPYKIGTPEDLQDLVLTIGISKRSDFYVKQVADINMTDSLIVPIGTGTDGFEGFYDGGGHVIKNVNMLNYYGNAMGLFNNIKGVVENLGIENSTFKADGGANRVGAFAGIMSGNGVLRNCYVKGSTVDFNQTSGVVVGALVGEQTDASRIESCYGYRNTVVGQDDGLKHYGYIVGYIDNKTAKDSLVFTDGASLCADKQHGVDNIVRSEKSVTDLRFNSGEICYLLNGTNSVWGQKIRTDQTPVISKSKVYRHTNETQTLYTNSDEVPYSVLVSLDPNHSKLGVRTFEVFKADDRYYVPDFMLEPQAPEWNNYYFAGWTTQANGKGTYYPQDGVVVKGTENVSLYALWDIKIPAEKPVEGTIPVVTLDELRKDTIFYKVYDYGGHNGPYGYNYNGKLTLKAPDKHFIRLTGTVETESLGSDGIPRDYMTVYDSDGNKLTNEQAKSGGSYSDIFFSSANGTKEDIGRLMSTGNEVTLEFITSDESCFEGLDLLVTVLPDSIRNLGKGSKDDPFQVVDVEDLQTVDKYIRLTGDSKIYIQQADTIDMEGQTFTPMASSVKSFEGHYDGGGYIISNMKIDTDKTGAVGFFHNVSGVVERLGIEKSTLKGLTDSTCVGVIAGRLSGTGQVRYCYAKDNNITYFGNKGAAGALVGEQADTTRIESSYGYRNVLKGSDTDNQKNDLVVGRTSSDAAQELIFYADSISEYRLRSGEICHTLNSALRDSVIWLQTIGTDSLPSLYTQQKTVYFYEEQGAKGYTNDSIPTALRLKLKDVVNGDTATYYAFKGSLMNFAEVQPDHRHFVFKGWNTQVDGSGTAYAKDTIMMCTDELMLYTQYDMIVVMAKDDSEKISAEIPQDIPFAKVYDDGGSEGPFTGGARYVTLVAPEGRVLQVRGTVTSKHADNAPQDYLAIYDGNYAADLKNSQKLANDSAKSGEEWKNVYYSTKKGEPYGIGTLSSSGREMTIFFKTDNQGTDALQGLDLTVTHVPVDSAVTVLGKGTEEEPYRVMTAADLKNLASYSVLKSNSKFSIKQIADIDMEGLTVAPLLNDSAGFAGHYDGDGYVIRNMKMDSYKGTSVGLFGSVSGIVERVGMENCTIKAVANDARVGALAGQLVDNGLLRNCYVAVSSISYNDAVGVVGALVGEQKGASRIESSYGYKNEVIGFTERGGIKRFGYLVGDMATTATQNLVFTDGPTLCSDSQGGNFVNANKEVAKERFASGEVCYLLNESKIDSVVWYQAIGSDSIPQLKESRGVVTYINDKYGNAFFITSKEDLIAYADRRTDLYLTKDIDLGEWNQSVNLYGRLEGGGHTIRYSSYNNSRGLFNRIERGASVKHLRVEAKVLTNRSYGGIALKNSGTISDCHFHGRVEMYSPNTSICNSGEGIAGIALEQDGGVVDHCSATGLLTMTYRLSRCKGYPISKSTVQDYCTWVDLSNNSLYIAQADSALKVQADYPVYAKGILDVTGPYIVLGNDSISVPGKYVTSLTIEDGKRFSSPTEIKVDKITYKRKGTNGAYEPWVLPFDYMIDASMIKDGVEFYRFEKDSTSNSNIVVKQIIADVPYQAAANEPLAFRTTGASEYKFQMKPVTAGNQASAFFTIKMPTDGVGASIASTKDMARVMVTYDSIAADSTIRQKKMYVWNSEKADFVLGDSTMRLQPFRYYLQYIDKATGHFEQYEQTDWARRQSKAAAQQSLSRKRTMARAPLSAMAADGWQPIILDPRGSQIITAKMLEDYEILALNDIYDAVDPTDPDGKNMAVAVIYEQVVEGMELPVAVPLLVKARRAGVEPLVTEQMGQEIDALLTTAAEEMDEDDVMAAFEESHYWCSTFAGRYDVWQMPLPESNSTLNEFGALVFADAGDDQYFYRIAASDAVSIPAMSYCFTAWDPLTFENLPLANDRIEIVAVGYVEPTGIEEVRSKKEEGRDDAYNLSGQKVGDSYRGIIIKNGKKIFKR